ncbi:hypothetical protein HYFRA_00008955 [Hymenoscyphus fraxineus]|uniref:Cytochrome P450 n=1 Tax=Hymenoscyphus fraxineus TaxID=746836 RepID=A0A9N9KTA0_9HELO|nr:hypothetical protein HYFRA_00008955 [Hymenoscyphus fraxineus]
MLVSDIVLAVAIAAALKLVIWIYESARQPTDGQLRAIPNAHFSTPFSRLWLLWIRATGEEFTQCLEAHRKLGPIIRIGPNEISINHVDGVRTVYGGNWDKGSMYDKFTYFGFSPLFAIRQGKSHAERKRLFTHVFSKSTIVNSAKLNDLLQSILTARLLPRLRQASDNGDDVEVFSLTREYSMDVVTGYLYGKENGTNWLENHDNAAHRLTAFQQYAERLAFFAITDLHSLVTSFKRLGIDLVPPSVDMAYETISSFLWDITTRTIDSFKNGETEVKGDTGILKDVWQKLGNVTAEEKTRLIASDMGDQLHAGHVATGTMLTYLMWELSRNIDIQTRLRRELASLNDPYSSELLDAVLLETYRMYPAGYGPFPRVAPENSTVHGFAIPKGTVASASPFMLGRNAAMFPNPDFWLPGRWVGVDSDKKRQMQRWVWMFMSGPRICIGEHLAVIAMKKFVIEIYSRYETTIIGDPDMTQLETFFSVPAGASLPLKFRGALKTKR